jgi:hypothetical protein
MEQPRKLAALLVVAVLVAACGSASSRFTPSFIIGPSKTQPPVTGGGTPGSVPGGGTLVPSSGGTSAPAPGGGADVPANTVRFSRKSITDPQAGNTEAIVFLLPDGWQYDGRVQWALQWERVAYPQTRMSDPKTGITIDWLPIQDFIWFQAPAGFDSPIGGNYQGKVYEPPVTDPAQFVSKFWAPTTLPELQSAQLESVNQVPQLATEFKKGFGGPADAAAYRLRYSYQQNGQPWEEDVSFALLYAGGADITSWYVNFAYTERAPKGQLDANAGIISTIVASRTSTPEWEGIYRFVQQLFVKGIQQQMADTQAFGQMMAQYRAEIQALQAQVVADRQASEDRIAQLNGQILSGVTSYGDPVNGGYVQLPTGYNQYWVNEKGEYLSSSQPGFDPNTLNDGFWQLLQPKG